MIKKTLFFLLFQLTIHAHQSDLEKIIEKGELVVALIKQDYPPFFYKNKKGELEGLDIKIAHEIGKLLGVKIKFDRTPKTFNEVAEYIYKRKADIAISFLSINLARASKILYTKPYVNLKQTISLNRLELAKIKKSSKNSLYDILNRPEATISVVEGSTYILFAKSAFPKVTLKEYPDDVSALKAVMKGEVLATFMDEIRTFKETQKIPNANLKLLSINIEDKSKEDPIAIALPNDSSHFRAWLQEYLKYKNYSTYQLIKKYNLSAQDE